MADSDVTRRLVRWPGTTKEDLPAFSVGGMFWRRKFSTTHSEEIL